MRRRRDDERGAQVAIARSARAFRGAVQAELAAVRGVRAREDEPVAARAGRAHAVQPVRDPRAARRRRRRAAQAGHRAPAQPRNVQLKDSRARLGRASTR